MKRETLFKMVVVVILGSLILSAQRAFAEPALRFNYEEAARTAAVLTAAVCQDGTSVQGVKFGLSKTNQSIFCMYTVTAQLSLALSASMVCEDGPNYPLCAARKSDLFRQGMVLIKRAVDIADEKRHRGLLKKLFKKVW